MQSMMPSLTTLGGNSHSYGNHSSGLVNLSGTRVLKTNSTYQTAPSPLSLSHSREVLLKSLVIDLISRVTVRIHWSAISLSKKLGN